MRVDARVQQEQQHGEQGDKPAAEQPIRQQPRGEAADEEEYVRDQVAAQEYVAGVFQPQKALDDD